MTIREIASIAGVSPATISLVLNNKKGVGDETRRRVQQILEEHNYSPSPSLRRSKRYRILFMKYRTHGMAVEENQGFIASIIDQIESECRHFSYDLIMCNCSSQTVEDIFRGLSDDAPDGVILLGTELDPEYFPILYSTKIPVVVIDNSMKNQSVDSVVMDNDNIAVTAVEYLYGLGHRKIGYLKSDVPVANLEERHLGYRRALEELGVEPGATVRLTPTLNGAYNDMKALLESGEFLPEGAVLADNDTIAIGASKALMEAGYRVPQDLSIVGVDDIPFSAMTMPALTTMRVSRSALGTLAVDLVRKRMKHPDWPALHMMVSGQLIERDSAVPAGRG